MRYGAMGIGARSTLSGDVATLAAAAAGVSVITSPAAASDEPVQGEVFHPHLGAQSVGKHPD